MPEHDPFSDLLREAEPPPALKGRVLRDVRRRGLVRRPWGARLAALAAGAALFAAGLWTGGREAAVLPGAQFALLLYEPAGFDTTRSHEELAAEYGAWAASLGEQFVAGEALGAQRLVGGAVGDDVPTGFFLVRAADWDRAMAIAAACPHLRHGGIVAVRAILT